MQTSGCNSVEFYGVLIMKKYQQIEQQRRDATALIYDEWYRASKGILFDIRERELFRDIAGKCHGGLFVDLGSGTGRITEVIATFAKLTIAIDLSCISLQILKQKSLPNCVPICTEVSSGIPLRDASVDLVVSCQVLQHMREDEIISTLREIYRILRLGGIFAFSVYNLHYWRFGGEMERCGVDGSYDRRFSVDNIYYLAKHNNFHIQYLGYYKALPFRYLRNKVWLVFDKSWFAVCVLSIRS